MITRSVQTVQTNPDDIIDIRQKIAGSWQEILSQAVTNPQELLDILGLDQALLPGAVVGSQQFQLQVPHTYIARIRKGDPNDPLLRQVLPIGEEMVITPGFSFDPLGEKPKNSHRGILHKYQGRLLLMPTQLCGVNCRFCFRRHFPYEENTLNREEWLSAFDYIRSDTSVTEVILSGGDPLALNDNRLAWVVEELAKIPHLRRLRIHTRFPVVIPQRITKELLNWLTGTRLQPVMVIHCNHPDEVDADVADAMKLLRDHGVQLLNQSALLKGVNDDADVLIELSERLFSCGVMPYYLHLLDKVQGAAHFEVDEQRARQIMSGMSDQCSGYLIPRLARENAGASGKVVIAPLYSLKI
ncbi:EF-P beta-lysylation protein EpmB [Sansalvadorimonas sp. 2012CJ34-2]|uniref:L-lysine 2,3-aminomutase n=1 Tax=Parendozoicomonas callyspongiae TaxID=2942213 RepID=A0ABT0PEE7_9GAMM|nr:EF-P beta-lysylation protein EpmB [Sansalvadorimonas sp. 2012CJ34-2]MCL6269631.1 EF-P beta-lysylation protein EpmB [Sansalvadorimonas sp. 2012CJ34-2]